ncbi:hypothetical protein [Prevotella veroralis]|uniref:Uncharacterized protein n=1 Tax=Prevotella veroralis F0319 TaxID=649761 RepID=C9MPR3_9BACT|nr:hypothetical protein [Prevotella veroralis]EEX18416.1 hypothetical protein HMPREF0973_01604 [Prevotella veroralis F0319]QUB39987.1 hypothetical protein J5A55_04290 [Prevotella veroralis]
MTYTNFILKFNNDNFPNLHPLKEGFLLQMLIDLATRGGKIESEIFAEKLYFAQRMGEGKIAPKNQRQYIDKLIKVLVDNGYIESVEGAYHEVKGRIFHTSKWVLSTKTIDIIKQNMAKKKVIKKETIPSTKAATPKKAVASKVEKKENNPLVQVYEDF